MYKQMLNIPTFQPHKRSNNNINAAIITKYLAWKNARGKIIIHI